MWAKLRNRSRFPGPDDSVHYSIWAIDTSGHDQSVSEAELELGMKALRECFPDGEANEFNLVLFSTSGVHGTYQTIEGAQEEVKASKLAAWRKQYEDEGNDIKYIGGVTFVILHPRQVCVRYGNCYPRTDDDFAFLKKLRRSSKKVFAKIGSDE